MFGIAGPRLRPRDGRSLKPSLLGRLNQTTSPRLIAPRAREYVSQKVRTYEKQDNAGGLQACKIERPSFVPQDRSLLPLGSGRFLAVVVPRIVELTPLGHTVLRVVSRPRSNDLFQGLL